MPIERSAGLIIFRNTPQGRKYLVIRSSYHGKGGSHDFWDFPKGLLEKGERGIDAAKREAAEEAGMRNVRIIPGFKKTVRYFIRRGRDKKATLKFAVLFLAESKIAKIELSWEHDKFEWSPYPDARERMSLAQMRDALKVAEEFLKKLR